MLKEIFQGIKHWTVVDEERHLSKGAFLLENGGERWLVDPVGGQEILDDLQNLEINGIIILTPSHVRDAAWFKEQLHLPVYAAAPAKEQINDRVAVDYLVEDGTVLSGGWEILTTPGTGRGEVALYTAAAGGAVIVADTVMSFEPGSLGLIPAQFVPERGPVIAMVRRILSKEFQALLLSHGEPVLEGAKEKLQDLLAGEQ